MRVAMPADTATAGDAAHGSQGRPPEEPALMANDTSQSAPADRHSRGALAGPEPCLTTALLESLIG